MRVKLAFWFAAVCQNLTLRLLTYAFRNSNPPRDLATEMAQELMQLAPVYILRPGYTVDPDSELVTTKH